MGILVLVTALVLALAPVAQADLLCVQGTIRPPTQCDAVYTSIADAVAASSGRDEVRVYGTIPMDAEVVLRSARLTGHRAVLDASANPGVGLRVVDLPDISKVTLDDITIRTSGLDGARGVVIQTAAIVEAYGLIVQGPPGGEGVGVEILPGSGRVNLKGTTAPSIISGVRIGIRTVDTVGRFSPDRVTIRDVQIGIETTGYWLDAATHSGLGQLFHLEVACQRGESIGLREISPVLQDRSRVTIHSCSVAIQIECRPGYGCGRGGAYDFFTIETQPCANPPDECGVIPACVAVRTVQESGAVIDGYRNDPTCGSNWDASTTIDGVHIGRHATICPKVF